MTAEQPPPPDDGLTLPSVPQSVAVVRRYAVAASRAHGYDGDYDALALLVSEVATNALIHGRGQVRVRVTRRAERLRVEVADDSDQVPVRRDAGTEALGGRGLALIDALSSDWGTEPRAGGKVVWFELLAG